MCDIIFCDGAMIINLTCKTLNIKLYDKYINLIAYITNTNF